MNMLWNQFIEEELKKDYYKKLVSFLLEEDQKHLIFPNIKNRFNALKLTPFESVNVVIIGQDPYHDHHQAHGLAFSVENNNLPPSLKNIFTELVSDLKIAYPKTGNLTKWAKQGVLLLNTILTVRAHEPLSHQNKGWEIFTLEIIKKLNERTDPIVFILWGANAKSFKKYLTNHNHLIIESAHPSPLSSYREFFGSRPFSKANEFLLKHQKNPIDWSLN
jgi:uracil-DNA glycosylase